MKTGILITARLKSTRLPEKVIKPIKGKPMISHLIDRLKLAKKPHLIVVNTSINSHDDPLVDIAKKKGIQCFRGSENDVLLRMRDAAGHFGIEHIISCTADNPFTDPIYIDKVVDWQIKGKYDYVKVGGLPWGTFSYGVLTETVRKACEIKDKDDTEVWGGYFTESGIFKIGIFEVSDPDVKRPCYRLTVDTPEDFELITRIFDELYEPDKTFSLKEIVSLLDRRPDLLKINENVVQKVALRIKFKEGVSRE